ncbi:hypothetical protein GCM10020255_024270 [Rhodococcus baikonurensis]
MVALDARGAPSFSLLQRRMHVQAPTAQVRRSVPVTYYPFDVLTVDGESTMPLPYLERRAVLEDLGLIGDRIVVPPLARHRWRRDARWPANTISRA